MLCVCFAISIDYAPRAADKFEEHIGPKGVCQSVSLAGKLTPVMSQRNRERPVVRAYASQDAIDMVSDDDWDEYETRLLQGSSSGTTSTLSERKAQSPSKSRPYKREREADTPVPTNPDERMTKRPKRSDESKSGKPLEATSRKNPSDVPVPPVPRNIIDVDADDSSYRLNSVVDQARVGLSSRSFSFSIKPIEIRVSAGLSRLSRSSSTNRLSKLGASVDVTDAPTTPLTLGAKPRSPKPSAEGTIGAEGNAPPANPKGKAAGGLKLVRPEKKKPKKQLQAEKKALELREKKMTRREFIQYVYEEKLKEELENAPPKKLVLKEKVIWYAEPGSAKASDSFDRKRYEMVCILCCCCLILAYSPSSSFAMEPPSCRTSTTQ